MYGFMTWLMASTLIPYSRLCYRRLGTNNSFKHWSIQVSDIIKYWFNTLIGRSWFFFLLRGRGVGVVWCPFCSKYGKAGSKKVQFRRFYCICKNVFEGKKIRQIIESDLRCLPLSKTSTDSRVPSHINYVSNYPYIKFIRNNNQLKTAQARTCKNVKFTTYWWWHFIG